jgi:hypothetical protein
LYAVAMSYVGRGSNPRSLENLIHEGRPLKVGEPKRSRHVTVSDTGWRRIRELASEFGCNVSELLEKIGRDQLSIVATSNGDDPAGDAPASEIETDITDHSRTDREV